MTRSSKFKFNKETFVRFFNFIKILRVEPYLFLITFQAGLKMTPNEQLNQDKICEHWYNTTAQYCYDLPSNQEQGSDPGQFKSSILGDSAQFGESTKFKSKNARKCYS